MAWFGLLDCNNFYCSCERIFAPALSTAPLVVLSNNDGCIISRSQEAKDLGIKMGTPVHLIQDLIRQHAIEVFSSNYTLYGDISARVMNTLSELCPVVEVYSIDEAFLDLSIFPSSELETFARNIRKTVRQWTKIPTCVGIGPTKALAKVANRIAKKNPAHEGVFIIADEATRLAALQDYEIGEVWGIGRKYAQMLQANGIETAQQFTELPDEWVKSEMTIVGLRLLLELRGQSCLPMLSPRTLSKNICSSRSFGASQTNMENISEAVSTFASKCGEKLREQKGCAGVITVFLQTNRFKPEQPQYSKSQTLNIPSPRQQRGTHQICTAWTEPDLPCRLRIQESRRYRNRYHP
ncbi:Y-family DNA polymerase [Salmonirosea aquatica]|uniref:Y-family DNA polymerase n=1 Tax=Salmonirosea aquatica TaxID=2654236 RepID=UPI0035710DFB